MIMTELFYTLGMANTKQYTLSRVKLAGLLLAEMS